MSRAPSETCAGNLGDFQIQPNSGEQAIGDWLEVNFGDPPVGLVVVLRLEGRLPHKELVGEDSKAPQVNLIIEIKCSLAVHNDDNDNDNNNQCIMIISETLSSCVFPSIISGGR